MMKNLNISKGVAKTGEFLSQNKKPLFYIGAATAVVVVGFVLVKSITGGITNIFTGNKIKGASGFDSLAVDKTKTTISDQVAQTYANQIWDAMRTTGTRLEVIRPIIEAINAEDYKLVYNAFNRRSYYWSGEPQKLLSVLFGFDDLDLNEWFKRELSPRWDESLYLMIKKRSKDAGLAF